MQFSTLLVAASQPVPPAALIFSPFLQRLLFHLGPLSLPFVAAFLTFSTTLPSSGLANTAAPTTRASSGLAITAAPTTRADAADPLDSLLREAYAQSPELRAAHARWDAALARPAQARALPDPTLGYGYFVQRMDTRQRFSLQQMFPGGNRRTLLSDAADRAAEAASADLEATAARLRADFLKTLADWLLVQHTRALLAQDLTLIQALDPVLRQDYRAGLASRSALLDLANDTDLLRADLTDWDDRRSPVLARLNTLLGQPADAPRDPRLDRLTEFPRLTVPSPDDLAARLALNPSLQQSDRRVAEADAARNVAARANRPDFMVGLEFMDNRGMARDELVGMISVNLPIWRDRTAALRREASANLRAAEADFTTRRLALEADAAQLLQAFRDADRRLRLYDDALLPRARDTLALVETDYRHARASFTEVVAARRAVLALEQATLLTRANFTRLQADWEQLAGPFPSPSTHDR